jgi:AraC family transcriptional regulator
MTAAQSLDFHLNEDRSLRRTVLPASGITIEHIRIPRQTAYEFTVSGGVHYIALHDLVLKDGEFFVGGGANVQQMDLRDLITYFPPGTEAKGWCHTEDRAQSVTALYIENHALPEPLRAKTDWREPRVYFRSAEAERTMAKLKRRILNGEAGDALIAEALSDLLMLELFADAQPTPRPSASLAPTKVKLVRDYIAGHLNSDLRLEDLANLVGLSRFHFIRAYKDATGRTPMRDVAQARVEKAQHLLRRGASLEAAATGAGFSTTMQMQRTLKRVFGMQAR